MAHYAFIENETVIEVITGVDETELIEGVDPETWYGNFRGQLCKRTSYNNRIRGTYAGVGFTYNEVEDIFIVPKPHLSWIREGSFWKPPIPCPSDENRYSWNEENESWDIVENVEE